MKNTELVAPERYNIVDEIEKHAQTAHKLALIYENGFNPPVKVTYETLMHHANQVAHVLQQYGLQKGDRVLIMLPRAIETYEVYIAALKMGLTVIPSSEMLRTKDLQYRISHASVKAVITMPDYIQEFEKAMEYETLIKMLVTGQHAQWISIASEKPQYPTYFEKQSTHRDDLAILSYTSGTTGNPKAVMHTHGWGYAHMRLAPKQWLNIEEDDLVWATAAPGWQKWIWSPFLSIMGSGAAAFVYNGKFKASRYLELLQDFKINVLCCTPTEYRMMAKLQNLTDYDLSHLKSAVSAGEPLNKDVVNQFEAHFNLTVRDGYGQTESTLLIGFLENTPKRPGAMGKAIPGTGVTIVDDEGNELGSNEEGNIAVPLSLPALFKGYFNDHERTEEARLAGYHITGDLAQKDEDGYFWFEGRKDDIIISSGYTIGPFEVEDALTHHEAVKECAVVASPHADRGHIVKAFVILQEGIEGDDVLIQQMQQFVKESVAPYKYPRAIEFVDTLPKTNSGKIRRIELRQAEQRKFARDET
ncbi:AMP-binding protein [Staphylococcus sp. 10602379]|uniref:acyl-CoA synthetase MbcS n=1 Tax=Staphylococcus sp. 10602379 TaxID=2714545 RepID=UPI0014035F3D|nr:AMP-binding protein [Staphylococcus sp. 10602379]NHM92662.1 acyl--CoA ligase [Staphylococcus sp. 10602379]